MVETQITKQNNMNYYIITKEVFDTINKANISFRLFNLAGTNVLVSTTDTIGSSIQQFADSAATATYINGVKADWVNGGTVEQWEIDTIEYIPEIDN
tara:strand:- start:516 stop:806 length:291 start_codon:yes stop_codon:yes gene_type:complete